MDNNKTYELDNIENNLNDKEDITLEINNQTRDGNLYLPLEVENYLNVKINFNFINFKYSQIQIGEILMKPF